MSVCYIVIKIDIFVQLFDIMVKGKKKGKKKRVKKASALLSSFKQLFLLSCALLLILLLVLYLYEYFSSGSGKQKMREFINPIFLSDAIIPFEAKVSVLKEIPLYAEIPLLKVDEKEQIVRYEGYAVSFNSAYKIANWVAYELTRNEVKLKRADRGDKFYVDPDVKGGTAENEDYIRSGYDRGHLAPAGDMKWSAKSMRESFYFTNIVPQKPQLNRGIWKELEEQIREWALIDSALLIVTGPVIRENLKRIGKNGIAVPDTFYKVITSPYARSPKGIAFLFANKDYKDTELQQLALPIDRVEELTGIDFFYKLPDDMQNMLESRISVEEWLFN